MTAPEITPRLVAEAIAALGDAKVRESWAYLDTWDRLVRAGVPVADVRRGLDTEPVKTEAMGYVARWAREGGRGLLVVCGAAKGTGKTYAATRFVVTEVREGRRISWVAAAKLSTMTLDARDLYLDRARAAQTMVIDDIGAGVTAYRPATEDTKAKGEHQRGVFEGLLMDRLGGSGSTLVITNGSIAEMRDWLGDRLVDRLKQAGDVVEVKDTTSRRERDPDDVDRRGRGALCRYHEEVVGTLGYDIIDRRVGDALFARARRYGFEACKAARLLLELGQAEVQAKARELAEAEARTVAAIGSEFELEIDADGLTLDQGLAIVAGSMVSRWRQGGRAQQAKAAATPDHRPLVCGAVSEGHAWVSGALLLERELGDEGDPVLPARLTDDEVAAARELAQARGCRVRSTSQGWDFLVPTRGAA